MNKPVLFNGQMVRAILEDRKTETRRIVKNIYSRTDWMRDFVDGTKVGRKAGTTYSGFYKDSDIFYTDGIKRIDGVYSKLPYVVGDVLWVRETWAQQEPGLPYDTDYIYRADDENPIGWCVGYKWHPSLHMPKSAARIFLKVTGVRAERLQGITTDDIIKEGAYNDKDYHYFGSERNQLAHELWESLWDSTIKKTDIEKYGWSGNPWVWVYEFERCEKPEGWCEA